MTDYITEAIENMGWTNFDTTRDFIYQKALLKTLARIADALEILAEEKL